MMNRICGVSTLSKSFLSERTIIHLALVLLLLVGPAASLFAGNVSQEESLKLDKAGQLKIIDWVNGKLNEIYVFPEVAKKIESKLQNKYNNGEYDEITDPRQFARTLSRDMMSIARDRHMDLRYSPEPSLRTRKLDPEEEKKRLEQRVRAWQFENFGFKKAERLAGNVGYLRFDEFADAFFGGETAVAVLNFFSFCDALIIDLRYNGGGHENMVEVISSCFFNKEKLLLERYNRKEDKTVQSRTSSYINGRRLDDIDLYILTGRRTFSAAEAFTFALKNLKRATVVGEKTGGGAHTVESFRNDEMKMEFRVPDTRAMDPETGENWEGIGVKPDVECPGNIALETAVVLALKKIYEKTPEGSGNKKAWIKWVMDYYQVKMNPIEIDPIILGKYVGVYTPVKISMEGGSLFVTQPGRKEPQLLLAVDQTTFIIAEDPEVRIQFEVNTEGEITTAYGLFFDGSKDRLPRRK